MAVTRLISGIDQGTAVCGLPDGSAVVASGPGTLTRYDAGGSMIDSVTVEAAALALAAHPAGDGVLAAVRGMGLYDVRFGAASSIIEVVGLAGIRGVAVDVASGSALITQSDSDRVVRVVLDGSGTKITVASGPRSPGAIITRSGAPDAYVLSRATSAALQRVDLLTGGVSDVISDLGPAYDLTWADVAGTQIALGTAGSATGSILLADVAAPGTAPTPLLDGVGPVWGVALHRPGTLLAGVGDELLLVDLPTPPDVVLEMPAASVYLSGWATIGIATTTVDPAELVFRVDPPHGGSVSHSRDATFAARPSVLLAVSAIPGTYKLIAHHIGTGDELAAGEFTITDEWSGVDGPPVSYVGTVGTDVPDPTWGGGDPFVPQNLNVTPVLGDRNVAVAIVETADSTALSATDQQTLRDAWQDEVFDGVLRGGVWESARRYWNDVSDGRMDLVNAGVVGPIRLAQNWAGYASDVNTTTGRTDGWEAFAQAVVADLRTQNEAAAAAGDPPVVDLLTVDSIVLVLRSLPGSTPPNPMNPGRFIWPSATRPGGGYQLPLEVGRQSFPVSFPWGTIEVTVPVVRTIQMFSMPDDWETRDSTNRVRGETVAHELGHNFGLPDEYARRSHPQWARDRDLAAGDTAGTSWSMMSFEEQFPQPTVVEKMRLGWVDAGHVRNLSFVLLGPVDEEIVLHATDLGAPPAGRHSVAEVRIADGRNYYFEYRRERPTGLKDQDIPVDRTVVGVDCVSGAEPTDRRNILRLRDDSDNDAGEFQAGDDYEERDTSTAAYPNDFRMEVLETGDEFARIRIRYGDAKPDPQITPWSAHTDWKSPDLRVTNDRNRIDPRFRDVPWEGHDNRIVATVHNPGGLDATGVRVDFFVLDFTLGGGAETPLGSDTHDVAVGDHVEFTSPVPWIPPPLSVIPFLNIRPHYCVVARIAPYADPSDPTIVEVTTGNNEAQSNHTRVDSVSSSASTRVTGLVKVTNPLPVTAQCQVQVRQTSPYARTYLDHAWVRLAPGEQRNVRFRTESMIGDPTMITLVEAEIEKVYAEPNSLRITGIAHEGGACDGYVTGGAQVLVHAGRATRFTAFEVFGELAQGRIETVDDGSGVDGIVLVTLNPPGRAEEQIVHRGEVVNGGFEFGLSQTAEQGWQATGHYTGGFDLAPCDSETLTIR